MENERAGGKRQGEVEKSGVEFPTLSGKSFMTSILVFGLNLMPLVDWTQSCVCLEFPLTAIPVTYLDVQPPISHLLLSWSLGHCELSVTLVWAAWHKIMCGTEKKRGGDTVLTIVERAVLICKERQDTPMNPRRQQGLG